MAVWDTTTPSGSDPANQGDDRIRELKVAIQDALRAGEADGDEALFPGPNPSTDPIFRPRMGKGAEASRPAAAVGGLYYNETTGTIQRSNGSAWVDLTENAAYEAIHQKVGAALASVAGVVTLPETGNSFNVSGAEAVTSIAGWSAGVVVVQWGSARTLTHASTLYLKNAASRSVAANDISVFEFTGSNSVREIGYYGDADRPTPTKQYLLSGTSATYTTGTSNGMRAKKIVVEILGAGGGGGGSTATNGGDGGDSSFNSIVAKGGSGGVASTGVGGAGGTGGSGSASLRITGDNGLRGAGFSNVNGVAAKANSGKGGGGGCYYSGTRAGGDGGSGEYVIYEVSSPAASYTYTVGAGGTGSTGGGDNDGGAGGSGRIIVTEYY